MMDHITALSQYWSQPPDVLRAALHNMPKGLTPATWRRPEQFGPKALKAAELVKRLFCRQHERRL